MKHQCVYFWVRVSERLEKLLCNYCGHGNGVGREVETP